jgi:hypothetical protein
MPVEDFAAVWTDFVAALGRLLDVEMPKDVEARFAHFRSWAAKVRATVGNEDAGRELGELWLSLYSSEETRDGAVLMLEEVQAFVRYVPAVPGSIDLTTPTLRAQGGRRWKFVDATEVSREGLSIGAIIIDSIKDMFEDLSPKWKLLLKALGELADLGKSFFTPPGHGE